MSELNATLRLSFLMKRDVVKHKEAMSHRSIFLI
jgi:hypothetical protein